MTEKIFETENPNALFYLLFGNKNKQITFVQKYEVSIEWPNRMINNCRTSSITYKW